MNVTINGYVAFSCNSCGNSHTLESHSYKFVEDTSKEAEDDEYIRYLANIDTQCPVCSGQIHIKVDVWEFPEAVINYSHHGEKGASDIQCEFSIEHYFDDQSVNEEDIRYEQLDENDIHAEDESEGEDDEHLPPPIEGYIDRYDDDD